MGSSRLRIPSSKQNSKIQDPKTSLAERGRTCSHNLEFEVWILFGIWSLELGAWNFALLIRIGLDASVRPLPTNGLTPFFSPPSLSPIYLWPSQLQIRQCRRSRLRPQKCSRRKKPSASRCRPNPRPPRRSSCLRCRPLALRLQRLQPPRHQLPLALRPRRFRQHKFRGLRLLLPPPLLRRRHAPERLRQNHPRLLRPKLRLRPPRKALRHQPRPAPSARWIPFSPSWPW
jgi:hypothetical protein